MTDGNLFSFRVPVTLDYLAEADMMAVPISASGTFTATNFPTLNSTLVDVSGNNSVYNASLIASKILSHCYYYTKNDD